MVPSPEITEEKTIIALKDLTVAQLYKRLQCARINFNKRAFKPEIASQLGTDIT
jgi:hypothetical protein